jgi:hypothetical protein
MMVLEVPFFMPEPDLDRPTGGRDVSNVPGKPAQQQSEPAEPQKQKKSEQTEKEK